MECEQFDRTKLPYSYHMLWLSLAGALVLLSPVYYLHSIDVLSTTATMWITLGVIIVAALYESFLLFILTCHMLRKHGKANESDSIDLPSHS